MSHDRAARYRRLALKEPDKEKAELLRLLADEADRGVLSPPNGSRHDRTRKLRYPEPVSSRSGELARHAKSIQQFGFTNPILVAKDGTIIAGQPTFAHNAARDLRLKIHSLRL